MTIGTFFNVKERNVGSVSDKCNFFSTSWYTSVRVKSWLYESAGFSEKTTFILVCKWEFIVTRLFAWECKLLFKKLKKDSRFYFYLLCSLIWDVRGCINEAENFGPSIQLLYEKQCKPQWKNILQKKKERIIISSFTSDSNVNHGRDSEARDLICSPPSLPIRCEEYCREACRDPNSLNLLASPLVRAT